MQNSSMVSDYRSRSGVLFVFLLISLLVLPAYAQGARQAVPFPKLVDVTASTNIHFSHNSSAEQRYIVESMSGGVALFDFDGDGWLDIYFTNAPTVEMAKKGIKARGALYRNNHDGTFSDVTDKAGIATPCWAMGVAVSDIDNDGRPDLLVTCFGGLVLYRNNGDGSFTDITRKSGLAKDSGWATGAAFGDYDNDGYPDLFVPHYIDLDLDHLPVFGAKANCLFHDVAVQCGPRGLPGAPDALYHNNHDGTFTEVSAQAGVGDAKRLYGMQAVWSDFRNTGKLDLLVANDSESNFLYRNEGGGRFKEIALEAGVAVNGDGSEQANMGIAIGDYEHSGRLSVAISHFSGEYMTLYRNDGGGSFSDIAHPAGVARATERYVGWGDAFLDLDNSGWLDLILANGHVYPQMDGSKLNLSYAEPKLLFVNQHNGNFLEESSDISPALKIPQVSRGLAVGDLFNRGALDVVIENLVGGPMILSSQPDPAHHWISLRLEGGTGNRLALNARAVVTTGKIVQTDEIRSGGSYMSQSDMRLHFGLGGSDSADLIQILWPDGRTQSFKNVTGDRLYKLKQDGGLEVDTLPAAALK